MYMRAEAPQIAHSFGPSAPSATARPQSATNHKGLSTHPTGTARPMQVDLPTPQSLLWWRHNMCPTRCQSHVSKRHLPQKSSRSRRRRTLHHHHGQQGTLTLTRFAILQEAPQRTAVPDRASRATITQPIGKAWPMGVSGVTTRKSNNKATGCNERCLADRACSLPFEAARERRPSDAVDEEHSVRQTRAAKTAAGPRVPTPPTNEIVLDRRLGAAQHNATRAVTNVAAGETARSTKRRFLRRGGGRSPRGRRRRARVASNLSLCVCVAARRWCRRSA